MPGDFPPEVVARFQENRDSRERVRAQDPQFFAAVASAMFRRDPVGLNFATNTDEYEPEAGTVIPRLATCSSVDDVVAVLHQEFVRWFDARVAGQRSRVPLAGDIWALWQTRWLDQRPAAGGR